MLSIAQPDVIIITGKNTYTGAVWLWFTCNSWQQWTRNNTCSFLVGV